MNIPLIEKKSAMSLTNRISLSVFFFVTLFQCFTFTSSAQSRELHEDLIVGKWVLESASFEGIVIKAEVLGGRIAFEFTKDGTATFQSSEGQVEKGRYQIQANQLINPDTPGQVPADIVSLTKEHFVMSMEEEGETVTMTFVPDLE